MTSKTLSKSRFKLALECPTKVFYSLDQRYVNTKDDDEFLTALADGGFQVGELAKQMYLADDPAAVEVTAVDQDEQVRRTADLLERENVTIFEGTIRHENLLVRVDVLTKRGNVIELIEVKSKSYDPTKEGDSFRLKKGGIRSEWRAYFHDVAFQAHVMRQAHPERQVRPYLLLVDPSVTCTLDGLGSAIRVERHDGRWVEVTVDPGLDVRAQHPALLRLHDVGREVDEIIAGQVDVPVGVVPFTEFVADMATLVGAGGRADTIVGVQCKKCEFYCEPAERAEQRRSGWSECIEQRFAGCGDLPRKATIFGLYNHRKSDALLAHGKLRLRDLTEDDVGEDESDTEITTSHRHRLQVQEAEEGVAATLLRETTLRQAFAGWTFPLHFIDFETSRPTLPFTAGRRPNQQLLFQFSHHVLDAQRCLSHRTQCLVTEPGVVPNAPVVRALRDALGRDEGTVLHWWDHERSVLKDVRDQLQAGEEPDREQLAAFIDALVSGADGRPARLVDMGRPLVSRTAFIAGTDGRSSIKKVLQAVMAQSTWLRERYGRPVYGTAEIPSLNIAAGWTWWRQHGGAVVDPYTLLGQLLGDAELDAAARAEEDDETSDFVANGGAAMVAYGELQRRDLAEAERARLKSQLLRYCELDTLAMVMVYEALWEWVG